MYKYYTWTTKFNGSSQIETPLHVRSPGYVSGNMYPNDQARKYLMHACMYVGYIFGYTCMYAGLQVCMYSYIHI